MKKNINFLLIFLLATTTAIAQDPPKRPGDINVSEYDAFKNNAFDILDQSTKLKANVNTIDKDVKNYSGIIKTVEKQTLIKDLKSLKAIKESGEALSKKTEELSGKSQDLLANAKKAGLKAMSATKNTKTSVTALDTAKGHLGEVKDLVANDVKLIQDELKARGEPIE